MAKILPFSSIEAHLSEDHFSKKVFFDTNIFISFFHDTDLFHDDTLPVFKILKNKNFKIYTNVTTRNEFVDYQRRLIITESLADILSTIKELNEKSDIARKLKSHKTKVYRKATQNNPLVISDRDIKDFKKMLSIPSKGIGNIWMKFCEENLSSHFKDAFNLLRDEIGMDIHYLSTRAEDRSTEINKELKWNDMYEIMETSGLSVNDAMILNIFQCSNIPYLLTTDFDLVYAASILPIEKYIFCPESMFIDYKKNFQNVLCKKSF